MSDVRQRRSSAWLISRIVILACLTLVMVASATAQQLKKERRVLKTYHASPRMDYQGLRVRRFVDRDDRRPSTPDEEKYAVELQKESRLNNLELTNTLTIKPPTPGENVEPDKKFVCPRCVGAEQVNSSVVLLRVKNQDKCADKPGVAGFEGDGTPICVTITP